MKNSSMIDNNKDIAIVFGAAVLIILGASGIITGKTLWDLFDFVVMGLLLTGTGALLILVSRKMRDNNYKVIAGLALLAVFFLVCAELAVGIFGSPLAGS